jgi:heme O synthase-like polyprenyltransferase
VVVLGLLVNVFAALLLAVTIGFYVGIYTAPPARCRR